MRIAYISYEYPPDTATGGIATYVYQISTLMKKRGHEIEVFCGSDHRDSSSEIEGILVHHVRTERSKFPEDVLIKFENRLNYTKFDVIESAEFSGDGLFIKKKYPEIPMVVKLHTPWFMIHYLNYFYLPLSSKLRFIISGLIRGKINRPYWLPIDREEDMDYKVTCLANQIHTPSLSLGDIISKKWDIPRNRILNVPNPFLPKPELLQIPVETDTQIITYLGRIEVRKGIFKLVDSIPTIAEQFPDAIFRFVGKAVNNPYSKNESMVSYIQKKLKKYQIRLEFMSVDSSQIPTVLKDSAVLVLPSIWENFPNVCLEAMSAGRAIVASREGGMKDMLTNPEAGILINPADSSDISSAVIKLLSSPKLRQQLGSVARQAVLDKYNEETIGVLVEKTYSEILVHE